PSRGRDLVNIADVGLAVSQCLPVIVALRAVRPRQIVFIEQPEVHLHPEAQVALAEILLQAASRKAIVIVETHSDLLLTSVQGLIASGKFPPELVKLHWFSRDADGCTRVDSADLDKNGSYGKTWPIDFDEVQLRAQRRFLDANLLGSV